MKPRQVTKVGVTGGIGSGKSVVCRMFEMLGASVYDSDAKAKELMITDGTLVSRIKHYFGDAAYGDGGMLDRAYLASKVFNNPEELEILNDMVHPAVRRDFLRWAAEQNDAPYVLVESAIVFESGLRGDVDYIVAVSAPEELRVRRAMARDGSTQDRVMARIANQMTDAERNAKADYVIYNDEKSLVWPQVLELDAVFRGVRSDE